MTRDVLLRILKQLIFVLISFTFLMLLVMIFKASDGWQAPQVRHPKWLRFPLNSTAVTEENFTDSKQIRRQCSHLPKKFRNVLLVISLGTRSEYESVPLFELLYKKVFLNRIYCGVPPIKANKTEINVLPTDTRHGAFLYECLNLAIKTHSNYSGYFFVGEDVILNYWNLAELDLHKIWEDEGIKKGPLLYEQTTDPWEWWQSPWGIRAMEKVYEYFVELDYYDKRKTKLTKGDWTPQWDAGQSLNSWLWNGKGDLACYWTNRSVFYIPAKYSKLFTIISKHFRASGVRHNIAIPTISRLLTLKKNNELLSYTDITEEIQQDVLENRNLLKSSAENAQVIFIEGSRKERRAVLNSLRLKEYAVEQYLKLERCLS